MIWNKFLTWLDGYDRKTGTYTRAVTPKDNLKLLIVILVPIWVIVMIVALVLIRG